MPDRPGPAARLRLRNPVHLTVVVAAFIVARLVFVIGGLRFRADPAGQIHLLSLDALRADPFLAFTSLHIQPPLFNFFVGAVLRWSPFPAGISFQILYLGAGLVTVVALWSLLRNLGAVPWMATVAAVLVAWDPFLMRDETILTYETPVAMIIMLTALAADRYFRRPDLLRLVAFAALLVVGVLTRTTLNPLWFVAAFAVVLILRRPRASRRATVAVIAVATIVVAAPIVHDAVSFKTVGLSSYAGMNLSRISVVQLPRARLDQLIEQGRLSPAARVAPYSAYSAYAPYFGACHADRGTPVLDDTTKSSNGRPNLNSVCYLPVYRRAMRDSLHAIRSDPGTYAHSVGVAALIYSSTDSHFAEPDSALWHRWETVYAAIRLPMRVHYSFGRGDPQLYVRGIGPLVQSDRLSITILLAFAVSFGYGVRGLLRAVRHRLRPADRTRIFIAFMVLAITVVSVMLDTFENARFRAPLDPLLLGPLYVVVLTCGRAAARAIRRRLIH